MRYPLSTLLGFVLPLKVLLLYFIYILSRLAGWDKVPLFVPLLNGQAQTCFCIWNLEVKLPFDGVSFLSAWTLNPW